MNQQLIDVLKIASSIFLGAMLLISVITIIKYHSEVTEAMGAEEPNRLLSLYENKTDTTCICGNKKYGTVCFYPNEGLPICR